MHLEPIGTGFSQVAVTGIMQLGQHGMLVCNKSVSNAEDDNFERCRTIERRIKKIEAQTEENIQRFHTMETPSTSCVHTKWIMPSKQHARK